VQRKESKTSLRTKVSLFLILNTETHLVGEMKFDVSLGTNKSEPCPVEDEVKAPTYINLELFE
jgi:hypothetical protein